MNTTQPQGPKAPWRYSHTQLSLFLTCPRKYHYAYHHGLRRMDRAGLPAIWSRTLVHPALLGAYQGVWRDYWTPLHTSYTREGGLLATLDPLYNLTTAKLLLKTYQDQLALDLASYQVLGVGVELRDDGWTGFLDAPLLQDQAGDKWVLEFKTSRYGPGVNREPLGQAVGYCALTGARGFLLSHFQLTPPSKTSTKPKVDHTRFQVPLGPDHLAEWRAERDLLTTWIDQAQSTEVWPKNPQSCYQYGQPCPYLGACRAGALAPSLLTTWKDDQAAQRTGDPHRTPPSPPTLNLPGDEP